MTTSTLGGPLSGVASRFTDDVVVGVDAAGSPEAVEHAVAEASLRSHRLCVLHAWTTPVWLGEHDEELPGRQECEESADRLVSAITIGASSSGPALESHSETLEGEPGRTLVSATVQANLLVVGGNQPGEPLGSTTTYVLEHSRCPVLVASSSEEPPNPYDRIIVGLDGVESSHSALVWAAEAATRHDRPLLVLHAWSAATKRNSGGAESQGASAQDLLEREVNLLLPELPDRTELRAQQGDAVRTLLDEARGSDLLVVGSRRSRDTAASAQRSVAGDCVLYARGAVAVIPEDWRKQ